MYTFNNRFARIALVAGLAALAGTALGGPINPPAGPVASTMKTMTEVEPRIAINGVNTPGDATSMFVISQPGSYYLTSDVVTSGNKVAIRILASDVTIDLKGMAVRKGASATNMYGIVDDGNTENAGQTVTLRGGTIADFAGAGNVGVYFSGNSTLVAANLSLTNCNGGVTAENGALAASNITAAGVSRTGGNGLTGSGGSSVSDCNVSNFGIGYNVSEGLIKDAVASACGTGAFVTRSRVEKLLATTSFAGAAGVEASAYSTISGCHFVNMETGVKITSAGVTVERSTFSGSMGVRIQGNDAVVRENVFKQMATSGATLGICIRSEAGVTRGVIENNEGSSFVYGISIVAAGNTVIGNRFGSPLGTNEAIYSFPAGTRHGPVVKVGGSASTVLVSASSSSTAASTLGSADPTANLYW